MNNHGYVTVWDVGIGEQEGEELKVRKGHVIMITHVSDAVVACGVGNKYEYDTVGTISLFKPKGIQANTKGHFLHQGANRFKPRSIQANTKEDFLHQGENQFKPREETVE